MEYLIYSVIAYFVVGLIIAVVTVYYANKNNLIVEWTVLLLIPGWFIFLVLYLIDLIRAKLP